MITIKSIDTLYANAVWFSTWCAVCVLFVVYLCDFTGYKMFTNVLFFAMSLTLVASQRPSFAGTRPIGYPEVIKTTTEGLVNKFGEDKPTTVRLPFDANRDKDLIDRLSKLPVDQQPFPFVNWQAYEALMKNPQTYPQKPNVFIDTTSSSNMNINPSNNNNNVMAPNFNQNIPSFTIANQPTTPQPSNNFDLNNRNGDSSDSLVPEKIQSQLPTNPQTVNIDTTKEKPQEYIIVNGVLYRVVESQKLPK